MKVVVAGASGLLGSALARALHARGDSVVTLVRRPARAPEERSWDPGSGRLDPDALRGADAVVNLGGAGLGDRRWTSSYKEVIRSSRVQPTSLLARTLAAHGGGATTFVQGSAVGFYGDRGDTVLDETDPAGVGFIAELVADWEDATAPAVGAGIRVATARTGIVLTSEGGALSRLIPLARLGVAGRLGPGTQFWSWITLEDQVRALLHVLDHPVHGPVNLVSPAPATNADLVRALARGYGRPALLPVPAWALRVGLGEFATELTASQRVNPAVLTTSGFEFTHARLDEAISSVVSPRRVRPPR